MKPESQSIFKTVASVHLGAVESLPGSQKCQCVCHQSPIVVHCDNAMPMEKEEITLQSSPFSAKTVIENNTLLVEDREKNTETSIMLDAHDYQQKFDFKQFHFHISAEHIVVPEGNGHREVQEDGLNEKRQAAEMHMVFQSPEGQYAVVGIIFRIGAADPVIEAVLDAHKQQNSCTLDLSDMLSHGENAVYMPGSLTVPPYSENVHWMVAEKEKTISPEQLERLKSFMGKENARNLQESGDRPLYKTLINKRNI